MALPDVARSRPAASWSSVDLPEPEGPMTAVKVPRSNPSVTPSSARTAPSPRPNTRTRSCTWTTALVWTGLCVRSVVGIPAACSAPHGADRGPPGMPRARHGYARVRLSVRLRAQVREQGQDRGVVVLPRREVELREDRRGVLAHRALGEPEPVPDALVRAALGDQG